ncbi:MAG: amidohydrolase family protein, partial [Deltaproteobacteria bacterium]|nr:amidohydrolase family protein [Deltaproteobacteria bacterium]
MEVPSDLSVLEMTFKMMKAETQLLYASDYPHWDMETDTVEKLRARTDLSGSAKRKILGENAIRFYGLKV